MTYHPHIDGLRAIAVLSVIMFHLDLKWFQGGFVGVDVFFVISGFLITSIIVNEVNVTGGFQLKNFYARRARRLLPALFSVLAICTAISLSIYSSERLYDFGVELIYSVVSAANFHFWLDSGYFSTRSDTKPLLHMWSLSVEEQFYLIWPFVFAMAYKKLSRKALFLIGFIGIFVNLSINIIFAYVEFEGITNQIAMMFYLMPFRAYEFLIGAFGVWAFSKVPASDRVRDGLFWIGIISISIAIVQYNPGMRFPHYTALLPCLGALCVILSKGSRSSRLLLENRLMIFVGLISYTLYLVHWPVIVFLKDIRLVDLNALDDVAVISVTLIITLLVYYGVEKPLRRVKVQGLQKSGSVNNFSKSFALCFSAAAIILVTFGSTFISTSGLAGYKNEVIARDVIVSGKTRRYDLIRQGCALIDLASDKCHSDREIQVLILGNSHEPDGYNIFHSLFGDDSSVNLIRFGGTNTCEIVENQDGTLFSPTKKRACQKRVGLLNDSKFVNSIDVVIFSSNRPFTPNKLSSWQMIKRISEINSRVKKIVLGTYFNTTRYCTEIANRLDGFDKCRDPRYVSYIGNRELDNIHNPHLVESVDFVYLDKFFAVCGSKDLNTCPVWANGEPMFYDQHHLSLGFARFIGTRFGEVYRDQLTAAGFSFDAAD